MLRGLCAWAAGDVNFGHMAKRAIGTLWGVKIRKTGKSWKNRLVRSRAAGNIKNLHIGAARRGFAKAGFRENLVETGNVNFL